MKHLAKDHLLPDVSEDEIKQFAKQVCVPCLQGKQHRSPFPTSTTKAKQVLDLIHSDLQGPMPVPSHQNKSYMMTIWDDATQYHWSFALERKSEAYQTFVDWSKRVETATGKSVKTLRTDNGGEYKSKVFQTYLRQHGILHQTTIPDTPEQNGKAERGNRTIEEKITCLLHDSDNLVNRGSYWAEAMNCATYLINRTPTSTLDGKTPYEALHGEKPPLAHLRIFGSIAYAHDRTHKKHQSKTIKCIFLGYGEDQGKKAYRLQVYGDPNRRILFSRNVTFDERPNGPGEAELPLADDDDKGEDMQQEEHSQEEHNSQEEQEQGAPSDMAPAPAEPRQRQQDVAPPESSGRPQRNRQPPAEYWKLSHHRSHHTIEDQPSTQEEFAGYVPLAKPYHHLPRPLPTLPPPTVPKTFHDALESPHAEYWKAAMDDEMESMESNGVWELVDAPSDRKSVGGRWVYALKRDRDGQVLKFKARWVAKGYSQREGIDYEETYAPVSRMNTLRIFFAIAATEDLELLQGDFKTAFLTAPLVETVYMDQPEGYEMKGERGQKLVAHLLKALYGLKQASLAFYLRSSRFFDTIDLHHIEADHCMYVGWKDGRRRLLVQYVDDFAIAGSKEDIEEIMEAIKEEFVIDERGQLDGGMMLGMEVKRDRVRKTITLTQRRYADDVLERFGLSIAKPARTPMDEHKQLAISEGSVAISLPTRESLVDDLQNK